MSAKAIMTKVTIGIAIVCLCAACATTGFLGVQWMVENQALTPIVNMLASVYTGFSENDFRTLKPGDHLVDRNGKSWEVTRPWARKLYTEYGNRWTDEFLTATDREENCEEILRLYRLAMHTKEIRRWPEGTAKTARF